MTGKRAVFIAGRDFNLYRSRLPVMRALIDRGWQVHGLASSTPDFRAQLADHGVIPHHIPFYRHGLGPARDLSARRKISAVLKDVRPAILHCFNPKPIFLTAAAFPLLPKTARNFCTVTGAGFVQSKSVKAVVLSRIYSRALSRFDGITFENTSDAQAFRGFASVARVPHVVQISSGVDLTLFPDPHRPVSTPLRFLFASRLVWSKGIAELLEAAKQLQEQYPDRLEVRIAGEPEPQHPEGVPEDVLKRAAANGSVKMLGHVPLHDMPRQLSEADVVVLPSYREGFSKFLMEGAAAGNALLTSDIPGCREAVRPGISGMLFPPRSTEALRAAMAKMIEDPASVRDMGDAARLHAEQAFGSDLIARKSLDFYRSVGVVL